MIVRPLHFCDVTVEGALWPVFGWAVEGEDGTILVDTGMIDPTPALDARWRPVLRPWPELGDVSAVINTHLHFTTAAATVVSPACRRTCSARSSLQPRDRTT